MPKKRVPQRRNDQGRVLGHNVVGVHNTVGARRRLAQFVNWEAPFLVASGLCLLGALFYLLIDPSERIFGKPAVSSEPGAA